MKKIIIAVTIIFICSCTGLNKYLEESDIQNLEQTEEEVKYDPSTGKITQTRTTTTKITNESNKVESETVPENPKENWFQKVWTSIQSKINYIITIAIILTALFFFVKFNGIKYIKEAISKARKQIK